MWALLNGEYPVYNIRDLRQRAGLTQEKLAEGADLHLVYISQVERGTKAVSIEALCRSRSLWVSPCPISCAASEGTSGLQSVAAEYSVYPMNLDSGCNKFSRSGEAAVYKDCKGNVVVWPGRESALEKFV